MAELPRSELPGANFRSSVWFDGKEHLECHPRARYCELLRGVQFGGGFEQWERSVEKVLFVALK
jgi:hypothetical protein